MLRFTGDGVRELHRSPRLDDDGTAARLARARELTAEADRQVRMASLLAGGGFEAESRAPAGEAIKFVLCSLAMASGDDDPGEDLDASALADALADKGALPKDLRREISAAEGDDPGPLAAAGNLLAHVRAMLDDSAKPSGAE